MTEVRDIIFLYVTFNNIKLLRLIYNGRRFTINNGYQKEKIKHDIEKNRAELDRGLLRSRS